MANTREIPREEWAAFLDAFSRVHQGWRAKLEIFGTDIGAQEESAGLPLTGVTAELGKGRPERITIELGTAADDHVRHAISGPSRIRLLQSGEGADEALEIEGEGSPALLRFLSAPVPEAVDGMVPELTKAERGGPPET